MLESEMPVSGSYIAFDRRRFSFCATIGVFSIEAVRRTPGNLQTSADICHSDSHHCDGVSLFLACPTYIWPETRVGTPLPTQATTITPPPGFVLDSPGCAQDLQTADSRPQEYKSLPSGTRITPDIGRGYGKLTASNGRDEDAAVRLSDAVTNQTIRYFFVQAHRSVHVDHIPQGTYRLAYTAGLNWIESDDTFSCDPDFREFPGTVEFNEYRDSEGVHYHTEFVTLNTVPFGNVRTKQITREEFLRGHHHVDLQR